MAVRARSRLHARALKFAPFVLTAALGCNAILGIDEPQHRPVCGDAVIATSEACDDGNTAVGDGCGAACTIEPGYACDRETGACAAVCGDGTRGGAEACDDGNVATDDGCNDACAIEPGFACAGEPSACARICGNGMLDGTEACDDANGAAGDGCDATCGVEEGFTCDGLPSECATTCGDGIVAGLEACDDGNGDTKDGCSTDCAIEHGFQCDGAPSTCTADCGDGLVAAVEQCDDGGNANGDGCAADCKVEHGYSCGDEPSACSIQCGDGALGVTEECDDGNKVAGDGCGAACKIEAGFSCSSEPSECACICGDGLLVFGEACDDKGVASGDGCGSDCKVEPGFSCLGAPSVCKSVCGDGALIGFEACDDGNLAPGDCCSPTCQIEAGCEVESNGTCSEADDRAEAPSLVKFTGDGTFRGAVSPVGDTDVYVMDLADATSVVRIETFDGTGLDCGSGVNTKLSLLPGSCIVPQQQDPSPLDAEHHGIGLCSAITVRLAGGSYYLKVAQAVGNLTIPAYKLEVDVHANAGFETEPNDTAATADSLAGTSLFVAGNHTLGTDADYYKITVPSLKSVRAEIIEGGNETCEQGDGIASRLTLSSASNPLLSLVDVGGGRGSCSLIDGTGAAPKDPSAHNLPAGVYYLRVEADPLATAEGKKFDYRLAVTIR